MIIENKGIMTAYVQSCWAVSYDNPLQYFLLKQMIEISSAIRAKKKSNNTEK